MEHTRRGFLGLIAAFGAEAVLDPERLLWRRGAKLISIPKSSSVPKFKSLFKLFDELADASGYTWSVHPDDTISFEISFSKDPIFKVGQKLLIDMNGQSYESEIKAAKIIEQISGELGLEIETRVGPSRKENMPCLDIIAKAARQTNWEL